MPAIHAGAGRGTPRSTRRAVIAALAALLIASQPAWAAPPVNDDVTGMLPLGLNMPVQGTLVEASDDYRSGEPSCFAGVGQVPTEAAGTDVAFRFAAPTDGQYVFRTLHTAGNPVLLSTLSQPPALSGPQQLKCLLASNRTTAEADARSEEIGPLTLFTGQVVYVIVDQVAAVPANFELVAERASATEAEPNNTPATAGSAGCGLRGRIAPLGDVDFHSLGASTGTAFAMAEAFGSSVTDADLRATTAVSTVEFDDSDADGRFGPAAPVLAGTPLAALPSYLRVSSPAQVDPYRLYSTVQPPFASATPETEPNDTPALADNSPINYLRGATAPGDADYFAFFQPARTTAFVALDADPLRDNTPQDATLTLARANGDVVTAADSNSSSNTAPGAGSLTATTPSSPAEGLTWRAPQSAVNMVKVTGTGGDYGLSIAINCRPGQPPFIGIGPADLPDGNAGAPYEQTLTASGGSGEVLYDVQSGALPPGLSLGPGGKLAGTPTQAGSFTFSAIAIDQQDFTGEQTYTIAVAAAPAQPGADPGTAPQPSIPGPPAVDGGPLARRARCAGRTASIVGTPAADRLRGTPKADVIQALGGNDTVSGLGGADLLCGNAGRDTLRGGGGRDSLKGDAGGDRLLGGGGRDNCAGGGGKDTGSACEAGRL